jgi:hypothetical protein
MHRQQTNQRLRPNNFTDMIKAPTDILKTDALVIGGDWNAKAVADRDRWEIVIGKYGHGNERCDNY